MPKQIPWQIILIFCCCSVPDSLWPMDSSTPGFPVLYCSGVCSNTWPLTWWCYPPSHPLSFPSPPALNLSQQVLFNKSTFHIRWPKYCSFSFSFSIKPSNEYSGLIFFRINWFDLLAVQWTLKSLLQHHSLKGSVLQCSAFFMIQLWHQQMTTGKTIALTRRAFVSKVMSLVSNVLSRFVIAFLPRNKCL